jgi:hypothetical protein
MKLTGENWQLGEKPVPVPLCPPQTPHGLTRDRTRASAVEGRRLTAWAMARPICLPYCCCQFKFGNNKLLPRFVTKLWWSYGKYFPSRVDGWEIIGEFYGKSLKMHTWHQLPYLTVCYFVLSLSISHLKTTA